MKNAFGTMYKIKLLVEINGNDAVIDLISYEEFMLEKTEKSVASGDLSKVYGDSGFAFTIFSQDSRLAVGDKIKIGENKIEVVCVASEGIGSVSGSTVVVCSEENFMRLTGEQGYMMVNAILEKGAPEVAVDQIRSLADGYEFADRRDEDYELYSCYIALIGYSGLRHMVF